jgi:cysteine desulfurase
MPADPWIYLDNHATTRLDPLVLEAMLPWLTNHYGNAGSGTHDLGLEARAVVETARHQVAAAVGATPREIVFTSGATESVNLALLGAASRRPGGRLVVVATEHAAVLDTADQLERQGWPLTRLPVAGRDSDCPGLIDLDRLANEVDDQTVVVSVMLANNEIGLIQPLADVAAIVRRHGALLHVDCAQAIGNLAVDVDSLDADLASFSAHKCHGPKGVGALYVRRRQRLVRLDPQTFGGGQERGLRSGTLNVPGIVGMGRACELATAGVPNTPIAVAALRDRLWQRLAEQVPGLRLNGPPLTPGQRLPNNLHIEFPGIDGGTLLAELSRAGVAASAGSACSSEHPRPSHVLLAIGLSEEEARRSLRFGLSRLTTEAEIDRAAEAITGAFNRLSGS